MDYIDFLKNKMVISHNTVFDISETQSLTYMREAECDVTSPTLFDLFDCA